VTVSALRIVGAVAVVYSAVHVVASGIVFPLRTPNIGQVVEELQPITRQILTGHATVDHGRQYGPVFLLLLDPVYRRTLDRPDLLAWYCYLLDVIAIGIAFFATRSAIRQWLTSRGQAVPKYLTPALAVLWANFGPLYGVLAVKNVELWELACIMVGCAALMKGWRWTAAWAMAAAALTKMLPFVFLPYLLVRNRRVFAYTVVAMLSIVGVSQLVYGDDMGWRYVPNMVKAAAGSAGYGNAVGMTWHENVAVPGIVNKVFGHLETPDSRVLNQKYPMGFYVVVPESVRGLASVLGLLTQFAGVAWVGWILWRRSSVSEPTRTFWEWALVATMMLVVAPQISHDYMVLALGAFSFVLAACLVGRSAVNWTLFGIAVLLVANIVPRGLFAQLVLIDSLRGWTGYHHLTRSEAYQYFGFPLLGLLALVVAWYRLSPLVDRVKG
jgi:hypothetical protein